MAGDRGPCATLPHGTGSRDRGIARMTTDIYRRRCATAVLTRAARRRPRSADDDITARIEVGATARSVAWRHGDQRRDGLRQGRAPATRETRRRHRRGICARHLGVTDVAVAGPGFVNLRLDRGGVPRSCCPTSCAPAKRTATAPSATAHASTSSMSPPIPPARCISAIAAAPSSATRWPICSPRPATTSPRNTTSTTPARRSPRSPGLPTGAICRRSARRSARRIFPTKCPAVCNIAAIT